MTISDCQNLLIFGGSFDPPHRAHVELPAIVADAVGADAIAYIPTAQQPLKRDRKQTAPEHRLAMLRLAIADQPSALIITEEIDRGGVSYTVETLEWLWLNIQSGATMRLLIGSDQLRLFDKWRAAERIIELAEPAVMVRPPDTIESVIADLPDGYNKTIWQPRLIEVPRMDISSTAIRQNVSEGKSIAPFVTPTVAEYIQTHGLYQADD